MAVQPAIEVKIPGFKKLCKLIREIENPEDLLKVRQAFADAGYMIRTAELGRLRKRMKSPEGVTGNLVRSIKFRVTKDKKCVYVGFERPTGNHSHLVDQGHRIVVGKDRVVTGERTKALKFKEDTYKKEGPKGRKIIKNAIVDALGDYFYK